MPFASEIVRNQKSRRSDRHGSGQFGASRGKRKHQGLDIEARAGETVYAPIEGEVIREAFPYANDLSYKGLVIRGSGDWQGYQVKMFYVDGIVCGGVQAGIPVGTAQDLTTKYSGITNHVHLEVRRDGKVLAPEEIYGLCF